MAGYDKEALEARRQERLRQTQDMEIVTRVVAWGTVWDADKQERLPGEIAKLPKADAKQLEASGTVVTEEKWKLLQEADEAKAKLAALEGRRHYSEGPPLPGAPDIRSESRQDRRARHALGVTPEAVEAGNAHATEAAYRDTHGQTEGEAKPPAFEGDSQAQLETAQLRAHEGEAHAQDVKAEGDSDLPPELQPYSGKKKPRREGG